MSATVRPISSRSSRSATRGLHATAHTPITGRGHKTQPAQEPGTQKHAQPFLRRWITAGMLLVSATLAVLYISNAIAVNDLLSEITSLERERNTVRSENEQLRSNLVRLMSVERVTIIALHDLGMTQPAQPPVALLIGEAKKLEKNTQTEDN